MDSGGSVNVEGRTKSQSSQGDRQAIYIFKEILVILRIFCKKLWIYSLVRGNRQTSYMRHYPRFATPDASQLG